MRLRVVPFDFVHFRLYAFFAAVNFLREARVMVILPLQDTFTGTCRVPMKTDPLIPAFVLWIRAGFLRGFATFLAVFFVLLRTIFCHLLYGVFGGLL